MRSAVVRLVTPIVWRVPGHGARKLYGFARAEQGSRIDLLHAAHRTTSAARRVLYLRHALDESRHAGMFWRRSTDLRTATGRAPYPPPVADTERLFERLGELRFLAFVHRGEQRGRRQFERYAAHFEARGDARTRQLFEAILTDEHRHERYTRELLVELAGSERAARAELRRAAVWEAWRMWRRAGRTLATAVYTLAMIAIYLVAGAVAVTASFAARRRQRTGWQLPPAVTATHVKSLAPATASADAPSTTKGA
jgi:rubrerythrin